MEKNFNEKELQKFQLLKSYLLVLNLTKDEFLAELENKTEIGNRFLAFFERVQGEFGVEAEIRDFLRVMYAGRESLGVESEKLFKGIDNPEEVKAEIIKRIEESL